MGFRNGAYATVWSVDVTRGNFTKVRLSTSRKNRQTEQYEQDFSGFCSFVGAASAAAAHLKEKDRIKLGDVDVTTKYDKAANKEYVNYTVFSFEVANGSNGSSGHEQPADTNPCDGDVAGDGLPF